MSTSVNRAGCWCDKVRTCIDDEATASTGAIRAAQKGFPSWPLPNTTSAPADIPNPTYIGSDAVMEPTCRGSDGLSFWAFERVHYVARDPRAFVRLDFSYLSNGGQEEEHSDAARQWAGAAGLQHPAKPGAGG